MPSPSSNRSSDSTSEFELVRPTQPLNRFGQPESESEPLMQAAVLNPNKCGDVVVVHSGWRGVDRMPDDESVRHFEAKHSPASKIELDMTPMVDVTFLLLIFFMVTASFTLQLAFEQPAPGTVGPGAKSEDSFIEVAIDRTNTYYVTTDQNDEVECRSAREMRELVRQAQSELRTNRLVIRAHVDSQHRKLVTAWEAGIGAGMDDIVVRTTDVNFD